MQLAQESEPPEIYDRWVAVSTIASVLQRKCTFSLGMGIDDHPNFYVVLVGPPGCRKSTAMRLGRMFLKGLGVPFSADSLTREAFIDWMKNVKQEYIHKGSAVRHSSVTVHSSELVVFLGRGRADAQIIYDLTDWYDNPDVWTYRTKGRGAEKIPNVFINLIGGTTPKTLQEVISSIVVGGGLPSRMLFVFADKKKRLIPLPKTTFSKELKQLIQNLKHDLGEILHLSGDFTATAAFRKAYAEWYTAYNNDPPNYGRQFFGYRDRRSTHLRKLAMVLSASKDDSLIIDVEEFQEANKMLLEVENVMGKAFEFHGRAADQEVMADIARFIIEKNRRVGEDEILREFQGDLESISQLQKMLDLLSKSQLFDLTRHKGILFIKYEEKLEE